MQDKGGGEIMETVAPFKEKFKEFQGEVGKILTHRQNLIEEQRTAHNEYHKLLTQWQDHMELNESEKAKALEPRLRH